MRANASHTLVPVLLAVLRDGVFFAVTWGATQPVHRRCWPPGAGVPLRNAGPERKPLRARREEGPWMLNVWASWVRLLVEHEFLMALGRAGVLCMV